MVIESLLAHVAALVKLGYQRIRQRNVIEKIILALGAFSAGATVANKLPLLLSSVIELIYKKDRSVSLYIIVPPAFANSSSAASDHLLKNIASGVFILALFILLIGSLGYATLSGKPAKETDRAWDIIKFVSGFFIGTLTNALK